MDPIFDLDADVVFKNETAADSVAKTGGNKKREKLLGEALGLMYSLLFVSNEDIAGREERIRNLDEKGLEELIKILKAALEKQHGYFAALADRDHMFPSKVKMMAYRGELKVINKK